MGKQTGLTRGMHKRFAWQFLPNWIIVLEQLATNEAAAKKNRRRRGASATAVEKQRNT